MCTIKHLRSFTFITLFLSENQNCLCKVILPPKNPNVKYAMGRELTNALEMTPRDPVSAPIKVVTLNPHLWTMYPENGPVKNIRMYFPSVRFVRWNSLTMKPKANCCTKVWAKFYTKLTCWYLWILTFGTGPLNVIYNGYFWPTLNFITTR